MSDFKGGDSAWGPGADRHDKLLITLQTEGAGCRADSHIMSCAVLTAGTETDYG